MQPPAPLTPVELYTACAEALLPFETTAELTDHVTIIGQERAVAAIQFGIGMRRDGFNLYALGPNGTGKHTATLQFLKAQATAEPTPSDWCYVFNFEQPHRPRAMQLPAGRAVQLRDAMQKLVNDLFSVLPAAFSSDEYNAQRRVIEEAVKEQEATALEQLQAEARANQIALLRTPAGFAFAPLRDDEVITPEMFRQLTPAEQKAIEEQVEALQAKLQRIMTMVPHWQRQLQSHLKELNDQVALFALDPLFVELQQAFADLPVVLDYLERVKQDLLGHVGEFLGREESPLAAMLGVSQQEGGQRAVQRYQVNVLVDRDAVAGAPIVYEPLPTYQNLIGRVEHVSQMGALVTDFSLIKPGALHRANGGYLILDALKLLAQPYAWEGLKNALRTRLIRIESLGQIYSWVSTVSLEPEELPLDVKVILLGDRMLYYLLCQYDPDFMELFKVAADFEDDMPRDADSTLAYARLIAGIAAQAGLRPFERSAVARIIEHSARLAGDAERLTVHMQSVGDLLREADYWAQQAGRAQIGRAEVQTAIDQQNYRAGRIRDRMQEAILRETVLIDTTGAVEGQINGLAVYALGNSAFGKPSRITARVRLGKGEVIDIERQVEMGGPLHSKGVLILSSFLAARYAAETPFALTASLVFEQSYGGVDGDSASSAELYALLSALARVPLRQGLAVTGAVNQRGQVQAIGGVNEKIEGFFELCAARGLTGDQGVLIPRANVKHLMLRSDVVDAVAAGQFHIYAVEHVDQGIALLTGMPAGEPAPDGRYPPDTINGRVMARVLEFAEKQRDFNKPPANGKADKGSDAAAGAAATN